MNKKQPPDYQNSHRQEAGRLCDLLGALLECCHQGSALQADSLDLPEAEARCLAQFQDQRYLTPRDLAKKLGVTKSRVTKLLEKLEDKGLLFSTADPRDGRVRLLALTGAGQDKANQISEWVIDAHARVLGHIDSVKRGELLATLELLLSAMETARREMKETGKKLTM